MRGDAVTVTTSDAFEFDPASMSIPADTDVTVTLDNSGGAVEHDYTVEDEASGFRGSGTS